MQILTGWTGIGKLIEEMGELQQQLGKLMAYPSGEHVADGDLKELILEEMADVSAALAYFAYYNGFDTQKLQERQQQKVMLYEQWKLSGLAWRSYDRDHRSRGAGGAVGGQEPDKASQDERSGAAGVAGQDVPSPHNPVLDRVQAEGRGTGEATGRADSDTKEPGL